MIRKTPFAPGEYYHLYNRGIRKQNIFRKDRDWLRLLFCLLHFQSPLIFENIGQDLRQFQRWFSLGSGDSSLANVSKSYREKTGEIAIRRTVTLISFALMSNHFHLLVREDKEGGISAYMQRVLNSFTKYFNTKYKESGHLFQGPFQSVHVADNDQLLYTSAYIHRHRREARSPWSSYQDYVSANRWPSLLDPTAVLEQFESPKDYRQWVETSGAKETKRPADFDE